MSGTARVLERGDRIKDNDPRMPNRVLEIVGFEQEFPYIVRVVARCPHLKRDYRIRTERIHTDGKTRRSGFSLVTRGACLQESPHDQD